jgi:hypothetical protein
VDPKNKDQRVPWPKTLMRNMSSPFADTYFPDTEEPFEQAIQETLLRERWYMEYKILHSTYAVILATLNQQLVNGYNDITKVRMQLFKEVIGTVPQFVANITHWQALPEKAKVVLQRNYNTVMYMGVGHSLDKAYQKMRNKIDEV